jgi:hypothetical protein
MAITEVMRQRKCKFFPCHATKEYGSEVWLNLFITSALGWDDWLAWFPVYPLEKGCPYLFSVQPYGLSVFFYRLGEKENALPVPGTKPRFLCHLPRRRFEFSSLQTGVKTIISGSGVCSLLAKGQNSHFGLVRWPHMWKLQYEVYLSP